MNPAVHARRSLRGVAGVVLATVLVACGQKPGVHSAEGDVLAGAAPGGTTTTVPDVTGVVPAEGTTPQDAASDAGSSPAASPQQGGPAGGPTTAAPQTVTTTPQRGGGGGGAQPRQARPRGSDRTGAGPDTLTLAIHAPVTGAAPLPVTSFEKSRDLYWRHVTEVQRQRVLGRGKVQVLFRDDKYEPTSAVQVCRELAGRAFLLTGGGGTDQIQACGRYASTAGVPYFSPGVTEKGLAGLPWYFASSMTYRQQGPLLAQFVARNFRGKKVAAVVTDTPNFDDAVAGWEAGVRRAGLDYYRTLRHPKSDTSWYNSFAADLKRNGVEVLYINSAPVDYIKFAKLAAQQDYNPQYVGVGITMGLDAVLGSGCGAVDGGIFFSPFPGLDWARRHQPEFFAAGRSLGAPTDDIAFALWGLAKQQHALLQRYAATYGNDLTREDFRAVVERQSGVASGVFPTVSYAPNNHFGGQQVHVLQADCASGEHRTLASFVTGF